MTLRHAVKTETKTNGYEENEEFKYVKGIWDGSKYAGFEDVKDQPDIQEITSKWPPGPYALPMPVDGCPESRLKGWTEGYTDITWQNSYAVFSRSESNTDANTAFVTPKQAIDITRKELPQTQNILLGPYSAYRIKLNFCYKTRRNESVDIGSWPDGNYSIYGDINGCPSGFSSDMVNFRLGKISYAMYDGQLPELKQYKNEQMIDFIQIRICSHTIYENDRQILSTRITADDPFILLHSSIVPSRDQSFRCPLMPGMDVTQESLYLQLDETTTQLTYLLRLCCYRPDFWKQQDSTPTNFEESMSIPEGTFVARVAATTGKMSQKKGQRNYIHFNTTYDISGVAEILSNDFSSSTQLHWKMLDMGRTISVFGIFIPISDWPTYDDSDGDILRCYYGERKWSFLHFDTTVCTFNVTYSHRPGTYPAEIVGHLLIMKKVFEGRYFTFVSSLQKMVNKSLTEDIEMTVLSTGYSHLNDKKARCNTDMGMGDYGIDDLQISASSSLPEFPARNARPFHSSWCADVDDNNPFILVDLYHIMEVEGVTIWNWEHVVETLVNGSIHKQFLHIGARSFTIFYGESKYNFTFYNNQVFTLVALYPVDEPQTFMFSFPFYARYVKMHVLEPLTYNLSCLRFELHGCRKTDSRNLQCKTSTRMKHVPAITNLSVKPMLEFKNQTVNECNKLCINNTECSITKSSFDGVCLHYESNYDGVWKRDTAEKATAIWSTKICSSDYIAYPYIAYMVIAHSLAQWNATILTYLSVIRKSTVLTSFGYPLNYGTGESYKWLIHFDDLEYIKLVFTDVNFNLYMVGIHIVCCFLLKKCKILIKTFLVLFIVILRKVSNEYSQIL
ncbi:uncharacterized protein LOC123535447 [Mercenaria mercenaria]|uniref:uncharacterized protein LOC123535447 n=1 Tax=Mercenaria mercenaria TaxID=6596 RepID=UPI00234E5C19|nr:uncharacterized protein LOC123535447 [Mercenaria mercenaria]